jgi:hypothetical protein
VPAIAKTKLATSDPLDLCKGFALFPDGSVRAGTSSGKGSGTVLSKHKKILAWRGSFFQGYDCLAGICGPSYATRLELEGSARQRSLQAKVEGDAMQAGFFLGLTFELPIRGEVQEWKPDHWYTPTKGHWHDMGGFSVRPRVDLLGLVIFVLQKAVQGGTLKKVDNLVPGLIGSWGFVGSAPGGYASGGGSLSAKPVLNLPVNILPYLPDVGEVDEGLKAVGARLSTGPNFGFKVPVTVRLESVDLDGVAFRNLAWGAGGFTATSEADAPADPQTMKVGLDHTPHLSLLLGWQGSVSLCKLFRLSGSVNLDLLGILNLDVKLGTFGNHLQSRVGGASAACAECGAGAPRVEVVFAEPGDSA